MKTQNKAMKTRKQNYGQTVNKTVAMRQESKLSCGSCGMRGRYMCTYKDSAMNESEPGN